MVATATAADCATGPAGSIIDAKNYACDAGVCRWLGCLSTAECVATHNSQAWTCEAAFGATVPTCWPTCVRNCWHTCTTPSDCATPSAPYDADNYDCVSGICQWTGCNTNAECMSIDTDWVCR